MFKTPTKESNISIRPKRRIPKHEFRLPKDPAITPTDDGAIINGIFYRTEDLPAACAHLPAILSV